MGLIIEIAPNGWIVYEDDRGNYTVRNTLGVFNDIDEMNGFIKSYLTTKDKSK